MEHWYNKGNNLIGLRFYPQHFKMISCSTNGAIKGRDKCYDFNLWFLGVHFSYTNFNYLNSAKKELKKFANTK